MRNIWTTIIVMTVMYALTAMAATAQAADYPRRPINVLIGFAPGGGSDVMLSMVRPHLEKLLKTTMVPVYKPGSGADIAFTELAMSKPDGYTVGITTTPQVPINPIVRETQWKMSDLILVANVVTDPGILVVRADGPHKTLADFLKSAKEQPGKLTVGASSAPGDDWFAMLILNAAAKVDTNIVPLSGDGPSQTPRSNVWTAKQGSSGSR